MLVKPVNHLLSPFSPSLGPTWPWRMVLSEWITHEIASQITHHPIIPSPFHFSNSSPITHHPTTISFLKVWDWGTTKEFEKTATEESVRIYRDTTSEFNSLKAKTSRVYEFNARRLVQCTLHWMLVVRFLNEQVARRMISSDVIKLKRFWPFETDRRINKQTWPSLEFTGRKC